MSKIGGNLNKVSEKKYFQVRKRKTNTIYYHMWNLSGKQKWTQGRREQTSVCQGGRRWDRTINPEYLMEDIGVLTAVKLLKHVSKRNKNLDVYRRF